MYKACICTHILASGDILAKFLSISAAVNRTALVKGLSSSFCCELIPINANIDVGMNIHIHIYTHLKRRHCSKLLECPSHIERGWLRFQATVMGLKKKILF